MNYTIFTQKLISDFSFKRKTIPPYVISDAPAVLTLYSQTLQLVAMLLKFKKIYIIVFLLVFVPQAFAPVPESVTIMYSAPVNPYKELIYAIGMAETKCDTLAYNSIEKAVGYFQIRPIRVEDYNKRTGSNYKPEDMFDYETAEKVFLYYAAKIGPYNFEKIARNWNGSGIRTYYYWNRVKKYL
jgi:hypothetical protein